MSVRHFLRRKIEDDSGEVAAGQRGLPARLGIFHITMASDIDMNNDQHLSPPPTSPSQATSTRSSPIDPASTASPVLVATSKNESDADPTVLPLPTASAKPASSAKPRSTKPPKARSPSPSPPPPPAPPLQTVRLEIRLGGPSNYEVDISRQAKDTGQRPPTPPPTVKKVADSSDSEEEDKDKDKDKAKAKRKKVRTLPCIARRMLTLQKKNAGAEYYDTSDPFIDDSELALDERQFFAQTKQQGFYVSSGEVALLKDKTPKKPKSKKISFAAGLHPSLALNGEGTRDAPIAIDADAGMSISSAGPALLREGGVHLAADSMHVGQKRKRPGSAMTSVISENGKRKKVVDERLFHPDLQNAISELRVLIKQGE